MSPVSAPNASEMYSKKRFYEQEKKVNWDAPPGLSEPFIPLLPVLYYQQPNNPAVFQNVRFCDEALYRNLRARGVVSRPHDHSNCNCFMSFGSFCPGSPIDELDFHLAITKILSATRDVLTRTILKEIKTDCQFIQMAAVKLIIEYPHVIDAVERCALLGDLFKDLHGQRQFVERCVEFFVVYGLYRPRKWC